MYGHRISIYENSSVYSKLNDTIFTYGSNQEHRVVPFRFAILWGAAQLSASGHIRWMQKMYDFHPAMVNHSGGFS